MHEDVTHVFGIYAPGMDNATVTAPEAQVEDQPELVTEELLVEEISIDGMCGVY